MALDNPQERLALLGYLAGIIDGEGYIGLTNVKQQPTYKGPQLRPVVSIHMVSIEAIDNLDEICKALQLPSYIQHLKGSSRWSIAGMKRVGAFLPVVLPFLRIKRRQAELVLEFIEDRMNDWHHKPVSEKQNGLRDAVMALNTKGKNPQRPYAERL